MSNNYYCVIYDKSIIYFIIFIGALKKMKDPKKRTVEVTGKKKNRLKNLNQ